MANLKNITELPVAESAEGLNLIVNDNGAAKQIAASAVGAQADWTITDETSPAFVKNKPFYTELDEDGNELIHKIDAKYLPESSNNDVYRFYGYSEDGEAGSAYTLEQGSWMEYLDLVGNTPWTFAEVADYTANFPRIFKFAGSEFGEGGEILYFQHVYFRMDTGKPVCEVIVIGPTGAYYDKIGFSSGAPA